jgi:glycerol kinase
VRELGDPDQLRAATGLPLSTYFAGPKIRWILDNADGARERAESGELAFGTMDTWLLWHLTRGQVHATDVTNASRTLLMDLETLDWHAPSLELLGVPRALLPEIRSSSEPYAEIDGTAVGGRALAGILGDQQAAPFGQTCFAPATPRTPAGPARSCWSTPARRSPTPTSCSPASATRRATDRRPTCSRGRSRSPAR